MVEKPTLFPRTFFDVILLVQKFTLFPRTFLNVILMVKNPRCLHVLFSTKFDGQKFDVVLVKLQANENIRGGFPLLLTLKSLLLQECSPSTFQLNLLGVAQFR